MLTYFLEGKANGNNPQTRSLNLERKIYPYGKSNIQTKLGTSCPSVSSVASFTVNAGLGAVQASATHTNQTLHYLPSVPAVKEAQSKGDLVVPFAVNLESNGSLNFYQEIRGHIGHGINQGPLQPNQRELGNCVMNSWDGIYKGQQFCQKSQNLIFWK